MALADPVLRPTNPSAGHGRLVRNITMLAGSQLATWGLTLLWTIFVPRALGPRGMGQLVVGISVTTILGMLVGLGVNTLLVKEIARAPQQAPRLMGTAMMVSTGLILPSLILMGAYILVGRFEGQQIVILLLMTGVMLLNLFGGTIQAAFQGIERMEFVAYANVLNKGLLNGIGIVLVLIGFGVVPLVWAWLIVAAIGLIANFRWMRPYFTIDWTIDLTRIRALVLDSLPYWVTGLFLTVYMWIDSVMLSIMTPDVVVGWYGVPLTLLGTLLFIPGILSAAWLPGLSAAWVEGLERLRVFARPGLELVILLSLPVTAGVVLTANETIALLYGPRFGESVPILIILALALPALYLNIMANQVLVASNRQLVWTKIMAVATVANIAFNLAMIPYFQGRIHNGAVGAALSLLATELLQAAAGLALVNGILNSSSWGKLVRALLATLGMAAVVWLVRGFGLLVEVPLGAFTFGALALAARVITPEQLRDGRVRVGRWSGQFSHRRIAGRAF